MSRRRVYLNFPEQLITEPVIHTMGKRFDIVTNIRRAEVEARSGWVVLEIEGTDEEIDRAIAYASDLGVEVNEMTGDIVEG
ncbi:MAG TPA: NIL domain-containing protein [Actinomycetota bacterium]|nr:NIL domain-containing protein [Actinomycetota bacterium]